MTEMILIGIIALIAIGPKQLPEVARVVGRFINEVKRTTEGFTRSLIEARDSTNDELLKMRDQLVDSLDPNSPQKPPEENWGASAPGSGNDPHAGKTEEQMSFKIEADPNAIQKAKTPHES